MFNIWLLKVCFWRIQCFKNFEIFFPTAEHSVTARKKTNRQIGYPPKKTLDTASIVVVLIWEIPLKFYPPQI